MLILRAVSGSRLYGLATADSDYDWFEVHDRLFDADGRPVRSIHTIYEQNDTVQVRLSKWLELCDSGSPRCLEAMFTPPEYCETDLFAAYRAAYRASVPNCRATYLRVIKNFLADDSAKMRRHAVRLSYDLEMLIRNDGRFDPRKFAEAIYFTRAAQ